MYIKQEDHRKVFGEVFHVLVTGGQFMIWDMTFPPRTHEKKDIAVFPLTVELPDGAEICTGYGVPWPAEGRDPAYYVQLAVHYLQIQVYQCINYNCRILQEKD